MAEIPYQSGFGNHFSTEAIPGSLPIGQNSPQKSPLNLYAEQLSGTAFTMARHSNLRSWLYKLRPTVSSQSPYVPYQRAQRFSNDFSSFKPNPNQLRWKCPEMPVTETHFVDGIFTVAGIGDPAMKSGLCIYMYVCNTSMGNKAFYSADGDMIIVPQEGSLDIMTEMGQIRVDPVEIVVIPRGVKFSVAVSGPSRGYIAETFSGHFSIPDLGPIGANGLANTRDFLAPTASFEDLDTEFQVICKFSGSLFEYTVPHSVFDVVAWHGNYCPYKYDLRRFNTLNTVSFDHPDPSIFTVLTCPSLETGTAVLDFVIFPPRWFVAEHTFRPPYYHRNCMTEFMGNICGFYDAKGEDFGPGTASLHSCMSGHGPEKDVFQKASNTELAPVKYGEGSMQFMFETCYMLRIPDWALEEDKLDTEYLKSWGSLEKLFTK